ALGLAERHRKAWQSRRSGLTADIGARQIGIDLGAQTLLRDSVVDLDQSIRPDRSCSDDAGTVTSEQIDDMLLYLVEMEITRIRDIGIGSIALRFELEEFDVLPAQGRRARRYRRGIMRPG